jgi:hypothetical protein
MLSLQLLQQAARRMGSRSKTRRFSRRPFKARSASEWNPGAPGFLRSRIGLISFVGALRISAEIRVIRGLLSARSSSASFLPPRSARGAAGRRRIRKLAEPPERKYFPGPFFLAHSGRSCRRFPSPCQARLYVDSARETANRPAKNAHKLESPQPVGNKHLTAKKRSRSICIC